MAENYQIEKTTIWESILYPENMIDEWEQEIEDAIPLPIAYCVHDRDKTGHDGDRKKHVHLIIVFPNTTTRKHAISVSNILAKEGKVCCSTAQAVLNIRHAYEYLIHNTKNCRRKKKFLYDESDRKEYNGFDIGQLEQISLVQKDAMAYELCQFAIDGDFRNMREYWVAMNKAFDRRYFAIFKANNTMIARLIKGNYQSDETSEEKRERPSMQDFLTIQNRKDEQLLG